MDACTELHLFLQNPQPLIGPPALLSGEMLYVSYSAWESFDLILVNGTCLLTKQT